MISVMSNHHVMGTAWEGGLSRLNCGGHQVGALEVELLPFMQEQVAPGRGCVRQCPAHDAGTLMPACVCVPAGTRGWRSQPPAGCCEQDTKAEPERLSQQTLDSVTRQEGQALRGRFVSVRSAHSNTLTGAPSGLGTLRGAGDPIALPSPTAGKCVLPSEPRICEPSAGSGPSATFTVHSRCSCPETWALGGFRGSEFLHGQLLASDIGPSIW